MVFGDAPVPDLAQLSPIVQAGSFGLLAFITYWLMFHAFPKWTASQEKVAAEHTQQIKSITDSAERREDRLVKAMNEQAADTSRQRQEHREYMASEMEKRDAALAQIAERIRHCPHNEYDELATLRVMDRRDPNTPDSGDRRRRGDPSN